MHANVDKGVYDYNGTGCQKLGGDKISYRHCSNMTDICLSNKYSTPGITLV